jgi:hypothetical protein
VECDGLPPVLAAPACRDVLRACTVGSGLGAASFAQNRGSKLPPSIGAVPGAMPRSWPFTLYLGAKFWRERPLFSILIRGIISMRLLLLCRF